MSYKPRLNIIDHEQTVSILSLRKPFVFELCTDMHLTMFSYLQSKVVERHFHDIIQRYGETIAVDLTDKVREFFPPSAYTWA